MKNNRLNFISNQQCIIVCKFKYLVIINYFSYFLVKFIDEYFTDKFLIRSKPLVILFYQINLIIIIIVTSENIYVIYMCVIFL